MIARPPRSPRPPRARATSAAGFTLVEVMVALAIVAIALLAGLRATASLTRNAERQSDGLLAQLCAENALSALRLARQMPGVGDTDAGCAQAGRAFTVRLQVRPTPNPEFRRIDAQVVDGDGQPVLKVSTIMGNS